MVRNKFLVAAALMSVCLSVALPSASYSQETTGVKAMTNSDVIALASAGMPDEVIIAKIHSASSSRFDTSVEGLTALKGAGVSSAVIRYMVDPSAAPAAAGPAGPVAASSPYEMLDVGLYQKVKGEWILIPSEIVNWKTGGVLKSIASNGIVKGDVNGNISGPSSSTSVNTPLEFLIKTSEGVEATEYQLVHLHEKSDAREFRTMTGGVFHSSGGANRDRIGFDQKLVAKRAYLVTFTTPLAPGQYAFLAPGISGSTAGGSTGKAYTFHLVE